MNASHDNDAVVPRQLRNHRSARRRVRCDEEQPRTGGGAVRRYRKGIGIVVAASDYRRRTRRSQLRQRSANAIGGIETVHTPDANARGDKARHAGLHARRKRVPVSDEHRLPDGRSALHIIRHSRGKRSRIAHDYGITQCSGERRRGQRVGKIVRSHDDDARRAARVLFPRNGDARSHAIGSR